MSGMNVNDTISDATSVHAHHDRQAVEEEVRVAGQQQERQVGDDVGDRREDDRLGELARADPGREAARRPLAQLALDGVARHHRHVHEQPERDDQRRDRDLLDVDADAPARSRRSWPASAGSRPPSAWPRASPRSRPARRSRRARSPPTGCPSAGSPARSPAAAGPRCARRSGRAAAAAARRRAPRPRPCRSRRSAPPSASARPA